MPIEDRAAGIRLKTGLRDGNESARWTDIRRARLPLVALALGRVPCRFIRRYPAMAGRNIIERDLDGAGRWWKRDFAVCARTLLAHPRHGNDNRSCSWGGLVGANTF